MWEALPIIQNRLLDPSKFWDTGPLKFISLDEYRTVGWKQLLKDFQNHSLVVVPVDNNDSSKVVATPDKPVQLYSGLNCESLAQLYNLTEKRNCQGNCIIFP